MGKPRNHSGMRILTGDEEKASIKLLLQQARADVDRLGPSPTTTRLKLTLEQFQRTLES